MELPADFLSLGRGSVIVASVVTSFLATAWITGRDIVCSLDLICSVFLQCLCRDLSYM